MPLEDDPFPRVTRFTLYLEEIVFYLVEIEKRTLLDADRRPVQNFRTKVEAAVNRARSILKNPSNQKSGEQIERLSTAEDRRWEGIRGRGDAERLSIAYETIKGSGEQAFIIAGELGKVTTGEKFFDERIRTLGTSVKTILGDDSDPTLNLPKKPSASQDQTARYFGARQSDPGQTPGTPAPGIAPAGTTVAPFQPPGISGAPVTPPGNTSSGTSPAPGAGA